VDTRAIQELQVSVATQEFLDIAEVDLVDIVATQEFLDIVGSMDQTDLMVNQVSVDTLEFLDIADLKEHLDSVE